MRSVSPLAIEAPPGPTGEIPAWRFEAAGPGWPSEALTVGETYIARIEIRAPFWIEGEVTIRDDAGGAPRLVVWSGRLDTTMAPRLSLSYAPQDCTIDRGCGVERGEALVVRFEDTETIVEAGSRIERADFVAANGRSTAFVGEPACEDAPSQWHVGFFARPQRTIACSELARDDCISRSGCVLWGSEIYDPGYVCQDATADCEFNTTSEACGAAVGCVWDPGACYCPEGKDCACGGGPGPKCRQICGGHSGGACPLTHFCDYGLISAPDCMPTPDAGGVCERRPRTCDGAPNQPICACDATLSPRTFDNDCLRRVGTASGPVRGACP